MDLNKDLDSDIFLKVRVEGIISVSLWCKVLANRSVVHYRHSALSFVKVMFSNLCVSEYVHR